MSDSSLLSSLFLGFIAFIFPPIPVAIKCGVCSTQFLLNVLLTMVAFIPGIVHAWYVIAKYPDTDGYERVPVDVEAGRGSSTVTYVIVPAPHGHHQQHLQQQQPKSGQAMNYGTTSNHAGSSSSAPPHRDNEDSGNSDNNNAHAPPTYAEAVKGDHKVQSDE